MINKVFYYLDRVLIEEACYPLAKLFFDTNALGPIPDFKKHDNALLDSALGNPMHAFAGKELYATLEEKAAILYYSLIKNHPFQNGNKRIASMALYVFLFINDYVFTALNLDFERKAMEIAGSDKSLMNETLQQLSLWIKKNIRSREKEDMFGQWVVDNKPKA